MYQKNFFRYFLLLLVFLGQYCYGQKDCADTLFDRFRNDVTTEQQIHLGYLVMDDETRESYYLLLLTHSVEALVKYTDDSIPAVRAKIFDGICLKNADVKILQEILNKHLTDTAIFNSKSGCLISNYSVKRHIEETMKLAEYNNSGAADFNTRIEQIRRTRNEQIRVISGTYHGIIAKDSLLKINKLTCSIGAFKITYFEMTIREKTIRSNNVITPRIKRKIRRLRSGERVYIEGIKAEGPDKVERRLNPAILIIK